MSSALSHRWWVLALRGVVYLIFGLAALLWPGLTFGVLLTLFGIFALVDGVVTLAGGAFAIVWVLGIYALLFGVLLLAVSANMWRHGPGTIPAAGSEPTG